MGRQLHRTVFGLLILGAGCLAGCSGAESLPEGSQRAGSKPVTNEVLQSTGVWERLVVPLTNNTVSTLMFVDLTPPPPWERGNYLKFCFRKSGASNGSEEWVFWDVLNIHAENFFEITRQLKATDVELHVFTRGLSLPSVHGAEDRRNAFQHHGYVVITDNRIPREWFLKEPRNPGVDSDIRSAAQARFPESFRSGD